MTTLLKTDLGTTPLIGRGKVRDLYAVGDALLMVATDRISAFDHVLGTGIPGKGKILTQISLFWFDLVRDIVPNHLIATKVADFPAELHKYADQLEGRSMLVKRAADVSGGVRGAGIYRGFGMEGIQGERNGVRDQAAGGIAGWIAIAGAAVYSFDQEPGRNARREHFVRGRGEGGGRGYGEGVAAADAGDL